MIPEWLIQFAIISGIGAIGWFLKARDDAQGKQITALWDRVNDDSEKMTEIRERLAKLEARR